MTQTEFTIVQSEDGRVSIWPAHRDVPWGWHQTGFTGTRAACLAHIKHAPTSQWVAS